MKIIGMVEEPRTWREQLKRIISNASERQRIADAIGINPATLVRWAKGTIKPRLDSLLQLLENVPPHYTFSLSKLIVEEYPQYTSAIETRIRKAAPAIPSAFYTRVLNTYTSSHPYLRDGVLRTMILQQVLAHLAPMQQDLIISLAQCMPSVGGERWVRSLRLVAGRSTRYWQRFMENRVLFMGAESPVGQAVRTGRQHSKPDQHELEWIYSCYGVSSPGSFVATPILRDQRSAGCLYLFSPEMDFFRPDHLQLIQSYTELLSLAFEVDDFLGLNQIVLGVMPMPAMQKTLLDQFQQRVTQLMLHAKAEGRSLTRPEAEKQVWQALEAELLLLD